MLRHRYPDTDSQRLQQMNGRPKVPHTQMSFHDLSGLFRCKFPSFLWGCGGGWEVVGAGLKNLAQIEMSIVIFGILEPLRVKGSFLVRRERERSSSGSWCLLDGHAEIPGNTTFFNGLMNELYCPSPHKHVWIAVWMLMVYIHSFNIQLDMLLIRGVWGLGCKQSPILKYHGLAYITHPASKLLRRCAVFLLNDECWLIIIIKQTG